MGIDYANLKRTGIFFYCRKGRKHGHVIGEVVWLSDAYPEALYLYRQSLTIEPTSLPEASVITIWSRDIGCTMCGLDKKGKRWDMSETAVKAMFKNDPEKRKMLDEMLQDPKTKEDTERFLRFLES